MRLMLGSGLSTFSKIPAKPTSVDQQRASKKNTATAWFIVSPSKEVINNAARGRP